MKKKKKKKKKETNSSLKYKNENFGNWIKDKIIKLILVSLEATDSSVTGTRDSFFFVQEVKIN